MKTYQISSVVDSSDSNDTRSMRKLRRNLRRLKARQDRRQNRLFIEEGLDTAPLGNFWEETEVA